MPRGRNRVTDQPLASRRVSIMGVLNVTPDSFSDGGRWTDPAAAVEHGLEMARDGADVVDVGGESTRPGASPVTEAEELRRVVEVIAALAPHVRVSIDTMKSGVAEAALEAGASLVNDVSASLWPVAADGGAGWIAMHMQGEPRTMQKSPHYDDVVAEVGGFLMERAGRAVEAGVAEVWIDPGFGFGKTLEHNLALLRHLSWFVRAGYPVMVGTSRKTFLGRLAARHGEDPLPPEERLEGTLASAAWAISQGVAMLRVHDVKPVADLVRLAGQEVAA